MTTPDIQIEAILTRYVGTDTYIELSTAAQLLVRDLISGNTSDFKDFKATISDKYADRADIRNDFSAICRLTCDLILHYATTKQEASHAV